MSDTAVRVIEKFPSGPVRIPPSKSILHRDIAMNMLAGKGTQGFEATVNDDVAATARVIGGILEGSDGVLDCGESATTLRFAVPIALALGRKVSLSGRGRLMSRPMAPFLSELAAHGGASAASGETLALSGKLKAGLYRLRGDISSQYISALLMALPLLSRESALQIEGRLESAPYVDITVERMAAHGVHVIREGSRYVIPAPQAYEGAPADLQGDWSTAANVLAAGALGRPVEAIGLASGSSQGDKAIVDILASCGAAVREGPEGGLCASVPHGRLHAPPEPIDGSDIPDIVPPIAAVLAFAEGTSKITGLRRLAYKESDRLAAVAGGLSGLGAEGAASGGDALLITGRRSIAGGKADSLGDHRIAMMAALAAIGAEGPVLLSGSEAVAKSWPGFWDWFEREAK